MNNLIQKCVLSGGWRPTVTTVRFRRVNVQRPRAPHYERAKVIELVKPYYIDRTKIERLPPPQACLKQKELLQDKYRPDNPYERIVAKEIQEWFSGSKLIAFLHTNPITGEEKFWANIKLKREEMHLRVYSHHTMKMALDPDLYSPVHQLFKVHQAIVFCKDTKVDKLLRVLKKIPQFVLMAAIVEGKMLSVSELVAYSKLKDITTARAQLCATLCLAQSRVISNLSHHQTTLLHQLKHLADNMNSSLASPPVSAESVKTEAKQEPPKTESVEASAEEKTESIGASAKEKTNSVEASAKDKPAPKSAKPDESAKIAKSKTNTPDKDSQTETDKRGDKEKDS